MRYAGLDVHKREVEACVMDDKGKVRLRKRFACTRKELERFARRLGPDCRVALEATTNTWGIVAIIQPHVESVVVSNPLRTRAIAEAKVKTDKVDAEVLAHLLRVDFLPHVWIPDQRTQSLRKLTSYRAGLVADRTRVKNRIHSVLHERLIASPVDDLFGKEGRAWLSTLDVDDPEGQVTLKSALRLLDRVEEELHELEDQLAVVGYQDDRVKLLMTLPGVDVAVAEALLAALGDASRFKSANHAASYLGLVPSTKQSGDNVYHGPITKAGRGHARWLLVQAAQHVASHPGPLGNFFRKLLKRKNRNVAVVATARKIVTIAWHMLRTGEPYRYAVPRTTETKLARFRVRATGERRPSGRAKGHTRPASYGTGIATRRTPSIDDIYAREALPERHELKPGELKILKAKHVLRWARSLDHAHEVTRPTRKKEKGTQP